MINKPHLFEGVNKRIPIPIKGRGFNNQGSGVVETSVWI